MEDFNEFIGFGTVRRREHESSRSLESGVLIRKGGASESVSLLSSLAGEAPIMSPRTLALQDRGTDSYRYGVGLVFASAPSEQSRLGSASRHPGCGG
jgi:hypothetical protein